MAKKKKEFPKAGAYAEMEKRKPKDAAAAAFKHRPYEMDLRERKIDNGKER